MGDVVGGDVAPDVMHRDQRDPQPIGHRLGKAHPHQHRADEAGGIGHRHAVDVPAGEAGGVQGLLGQLGDDFNVFPGGDLRHHAAVSLVHLHRGGDAVGQHRAAVPDQGHRRLVAGGFDCQKDHTRTSFSSPPGRSVWVAQEIPSASGAAGSQGI